MPAVHFGRPGAVCTRTTEEGDTMDSPEAIQEDDEYLDLLSAADVHHAPNEALSPLSRALLSWRRDVDSEPVSAGTITTR